MTARLAGEDRGGDRPGRYGRRYPGQGGKRRSLPGAGATLQPGRGGQEGTVAVFPDSYAAKCLYCSNKWGTAILQKGDARRKKMHGMGPFLLCRGMAPSSVDPASGWKVRYGT